MNDFDSVSAPTRVMTAWLSVPHRLPEAIERIALTWAADTSRHSYFPRACAAMNQYAVGRKPHVTALAGRDD
jgi:hypothetical protein